MNLLMNLATANNANYRQLLKVVIERKRYCKIRFSYNKQAQVIEN
jgi:hypothetical protein